MNKLVFCTLYYCVADVGYSVSHHKRSITTKRNNTTKRQKDPLRLIIHKTSTTRATNAEVQLHDQDPHQLSMHHFHLSSPFSCLFLRLLALRLLTLLGNNCQSLGLFGRPTFQGSALLSGQSHNNCACHAQADRPYSSQDPWL